MYISFSVHPCDKPNQGGCEHLCIELGHDFICECEKDFYLDIDDKTCIECKFKFLMSSSLNFVSNVSSCDSEV